MVGSIVMSMSVCASVCPEDISKTAHTIFTKFLCMLHMSVAGSASGMLSISRIACRREEGDGSAQRRRSVIRNLSVINLLVLSYLPVCVFKIVVHLLKWKYIYAPTYRPLYTSSASSRKVS